MADASPRVPVLFRCAHRGDVAAIVRLLADDELGRQRERYEHPLPAAYYHAFDRVEADVNNELIVGELNGEVVATLQLTFIPMLSRLGSIRALIEAVRVAEALRGQGIGRALIRWSIDRSRQRGCRLVQLTTDNRRPDAHHFYASLGFVASHTGMKYDLSSTDGPDSGTDLAP